MSQCFLLLGTNIGDKQRNLLQAKELIDQKVGSVISTSSIYKTSAWGKEDQDDFLNQVLIVSTLLKPEEVLDICLSIEKFMGRVRYERWGERLIDIDILYMDQTVVESEALKIPHPEIENRRFTLVPLVEVAADYVHPILKKNNNDLLLTCPDQLEVERLMSTDHT